MILRSANITVSGNLKQGDAITVYRAGQHFVGYGVLQEIDGNNVTILLDKDASKNYSELQGHGIPFEFEVMQRKHTNDIQV